MNYEEFFCQIQADVKKAMGEEVRIEHHEFVKNNGVAQDGIIVLEEGAKASPIIYLDSYYTAYKKGTPIEKIVEEILDVYKESKDYLPQQEDFFKDYEKVKERVAWKVINYERNRNLLRDIPHICTLDLAVVFYYALEHEKMGKGSILIHKKHMEMWGITKEELCRRARENTKRMFSYECVEIKKLLGESAAESLPMYVLSNKEKRYGAVNILYDEVLSEIGGELEDDFFVLPSSIHECILLPVEAGRGRGELKEMVWEVNRTQVKEEEVLSDEVYFYDRENHRLTL